jgi:hypothetical protein
MKLSVNMVSLLSAGDFSKMLRRLAIVLSLVVALYVGLAGHAVYRVLQGLSAGDAPTVAAYLDTPSVKEKLKTQLDALIVDGSRRGLDRRDDLGAQIGAGLIAALGPALVDHVVDRLVTPEGLASILSSVENRADTRRETGADAASGLFALLGQFRPLGVDCFELVDKGGGALIFSFRDWGWRISEIRAPPKMLEGLMR